VSHIGQQIEFSSTAFPPCEEDKQLVNYPAMHGYALARYIADRLPERGFALARTVAEDWGWWCEVENEGFALAYACGTQGSDEDFESGEDTGSRGEDDFLLFVIPDKPQIRRWFRKIDVAERVEALNQAIFSILAESGGATRGPVWVD
jgi:hypothetical protein